MASLIGPQEQVGECIVEGGVGDDDIPVHRTLTFVGADWPLFFRRPLQFDEVWVSWPANRI